MTIKPEKRSNDAEKKETHVGVPVDQAGVNHVQASVVRGVAGHRNGVIDGHVQSTQRRAEAYDDLSARHRRSPHKSSRVKRHEQQKQRERAERDKHTSSVVAAGGGSSIALSKCGINGNANTGGNSPASVAGGGGKSPEHLDGKAGGVLGCGSPRSQAGTSSDDKKNPLSATEESISGYNSGDEHKPKEGALSAAEWKRRDEQFTKLMADRGLVVKPVDEDGACLFRAISLQIYGDEEMHDVIRQHTMDYIYKNREYFRHFVTEDINSYIKRKRRCDSHGNHIEIQAMSEIYARPVELYCYNLTPINIFNSEQGCNGYAPLRLSYQRNSHYNAILDPYNATVGVGLGLAGYKPELQTKDAMCISEQLEIEQTMFEDKLKTTDWEATNEAIEEQIARESYLQWCRENLHRSKRATNVSTTSATVTSAALAYSDSEASPSKYSLARYTTNEFGMSTVTAPSNIDLKVNMGTPCSSKSSDDVGPNCNQKDGTPVVGDAKDSVYESDDTDSTTSSIDKSSGCSSISLNSAGGMLRKNIKQKTRNGTVRVNTKRRREQKQQPNVATEVKNTSSSSKIDEMGISPRKSPRRDTQSLETVAVVGANDTRAQTPDVEQKPCSSKQLNTPKKSNEDGNTVSSPPSSKIKTQDTSNLYQELLEATYAADGFGRELSESELLQRAIQMSTQDYIDSQKRKYLHQS